MAFAPDDVESKPEKGQGGSKGLPMQLIQFKKQLKGQKPYKNPDTGNDVSVGTALKNPKLRPKVLKDFDDWKKRQKDTEKEVAEESKKWDKGEKKQRGRKRDEGKRVEKLKGQWGEEAEGKSFPGTRKPKKPEKLFEHVKWKEAMVRLAFEKPHLRPYLIPILKEAYYGPSPEVVEFLNSNATREISTKRGALLMASDVLDYIGAPASTDNLKKLAYALMRECDMNSCALQRKSDRTRIAMTITKVLGL
jgi:hypothetical protein